MSIIESYNLKLKVNLIEIQGDFTYELISLTVSLTGRIVESEFA